MHSKKHLSFSAIQGMIADKFANAQDTRAPNASNSIKEVLSHVLASNLKNYNSQISGVMKP